MHTVEITSLAGRYEKLIHFTPRGRCIIPSDFEPYDLDISACK